jgi:hypothetical protein
MGPIQMANFLFDPEDPDVDQKRITTIKVINDKLFTVFDTSVKMKVFEQNKDFYKK